MDAVNLTIIVPDITTTLTKYNRIRIWRSETEDGDYELITAVTAQPAVLTGDNIGPFAISGENLWISVNDDSPQVVTFALPNTLTTALVVGTINSATTDLVASASSDDAVVLTSDDTGSAALLTLWSGTALEALGFDTTGEVASGKDAHITLVAGQATYQYTDYSSDKDWFYKTDFYNTVNTQHSDTSEPFQGTTSIIPAASLIWGLITAAYPNGTPVADMRVVARNILTPVLEVGTITMLGNESEVQTDARGYAAIPLIKGAVVDISLTGTNIVRRITVPSTGSTFDLMAAIAAVDDNFQIQIPDIPDAVRRS